MIMAVQSGFFEAEWDSELFNEETQTYGDWDRKYLAEQFARYFSKFVSTGVMNDTPNQLKVSAGSGMNVIVSIGFALINGYWCFNDELLSLNVPLNESPSTRYDSVRVRWNATTRAIEILYIADDIVNVRNDMYYDLQIAQIKVDPSTSSISSEDITDTRSNLELCGLIDIVKASDISEINIKIGDLNVLQTQSKSSIVNAINSFAWNVLKNKPFNSVDEETLEVDEETNELKVIHSPNATNASHASTADSATTAASATTALTANSAKNDFILVNQESFTFVNNVCRINDERITANSLADVYFDSISFDIAQRASIYVDTFDGYLTLTANRTPSGTISGSIKIRVV